MSLRGARLARDEGFTLVELLISSLVTALVMGGVLMLLDPARGTFLTQPEVTDLHQRLRVGAWALHRSLLSAGAGPERPLGAYIAPILPYRMGIALADAPGTFRRDVITLVHVPPAAAYTAVVDGTSAVGGTLFDTRPDCGGVRRDRRCGFDVGMSVLILDSGSAAFGSVADVFDAAVLVAHRDPLVLEYASGDAAIVEVVSRTYFVATDAAGDPQLMQFDGDRTTMPVAEHVTGVEFGYLLDPRPPRVEALEDDVGARVTYGPRPRAGAENCTFAVDEGRHVPRLPVLGDGIAPVELTPALAGDGPWCPDAGHPARYDADLLRIRRVGVTIRVQAAADWLRGSATALFRHPGTAPVSRSVPDRELVFEIAPPNLNLPERD